MDAYVDFLMMQADARLSELRAEAARYRLIRSLSLTRVLLRRRARAEQAAVTVLRPLPSPVLAADQEPAIAQRRAS